MAALTTPRIQGHRTNPFHRGHKPPIRIPEPPPYDCELPPNPFPDINPGNPMSWYGGISQFMSGLLASRACVEADLTDGILTGNPSHDPVMARHRLFQISALLGRMYNLLEYAIQMQKENLKLEKATHDLAKAA